MIKLDRLKLASILSSVCLWLFVIAVDNPKTNTVLENIPVNISNTVELSENSLILAESSTPSVNVLLEGSVSDLRRIKKEDIRVSMEIQNPSEGKNEAQLSVLAPNNVQYELNEDTLIVNLDKTIYNNYNVSVEVPDGEDASNYIVETNIDTVKVSGPRSSVKRVDKVVAMIKKENFSLNKDIGVQLKAVDSKGIDVEDVTLENSIVRATVKKIEQKVFDINPIFSEPINGSQVDLNPLKVTLLGEKALLDSITHISTEMIDTSKFLESGSISVNLIIPDGLSLSSNKENAPDNSITISLKK